MTDATAELARVVHQLAAGEAVTTEAGLDAVDEQLIAQLAGRGRAGGLAPTVENRCGAGSGSGSAALRRPLRCVVPARRRGLPSPVCTLPGAQSSSLPHLVALAAARAGAPVPAGQVQRVVDRRDERRSVVGSGVTRPPSPRR
jgi:hypothetical protein